MLAFILCVKLLTAGHVGYTIDLEEHIVNQMNRPSSEASAIVESITDQERRAQGAMAVSNAKLWRQFWLTFVLIVVLIFTVLIMLRADGSAMLSSGSAVGVGGLAVWLGMPLGGFVMFASFLELLHEAGDALDDLIQRVQTPRVSAKAALFFQDAMYLSNHFSERRTARHLCWVLATSPVNSATMYQAIGGTVMAAMLTFLPGLLGSLDDGEQ